MNILLVSEEFPPETQFGGISTYNADLTKMLSNAGNFVYVICKSLGTSYIRHEKNAVILRTSTFCGRIKPLEKLLGWRLAVFFKVLWLVKRRKIDIIETPEWKADCFFLLLLNFLFPPIVVRLHGCRALIKSIDGMKLTFQDRIVIAMERFILKKANVISSISEACLQKTEQLLKLDLRKKTHVIPNFTKKTFFEKSYDHRNKTVLFAGRIEEWKGVFNLSKAISILNKKKIDACYIFAGRDIRHKSGKKSSEICLDIIGTNRANVKFLGQISREELDRLFAQSYVTVLPSLFEPFGLCCIESMKFGTPVIGSCRGGMNEIIIDGVNGYLVNPTDPVQIAERIESILLDDSNWFSMSNSALKTIEEKFFIESVYPKYIDLYRSMV